MKKWTGIPYKDVGTHELYLDVFVPETAEKPPVILWVHGGGWNELNRTWSLVTPMLDLGYAVASVDYRYCDEAAFPAQLLDLKEALLFVRKHADEYGYDGSRIIASGDSAGAHLACLLGVSEGNAEWERPGEDYSVQAVVDFCGPVWFAGIVRPDAQAGDRPNIERLLGAPCGSKGFYARAAAASPLTYINGKEPPFLILHGSEDPTVPVAQARLLRNRLEEAGDVVHMYYIPGGVHALGGELLDRVVREFLDYYVKGEKTVTEPRVLAGHYRTLPKREQP